MQSANEIRYPSINLYEKSSSQILQGELSRSEKDYGKKRDVSYDFKISNPGSNHLFKRSENNCGYKVVA